MSMKELIEKKSKIWHFIHGFSSVVDITGTAFLIEYNSEVSGFQKDYLAIRRDWINIGNDMRKAINHEKTVNQVLYAK